MVDVTVRKLGVKFSPCALVVTYTNGSSVRRRTIPVRNISKHSNVEEVTQEMRSLPEHSKYVTYIGNFEHLICYYLILLYM